MKKFIIVIMAITMLALGACDLHQTFVVRAASTLANAKSRAEFSL